MSSNEEMIKWLDGVAAGFPKSHIVNDVIAALSAPMPDDVEAIITRLVDGDFYNISETIDMLERLQRSNALSTSLANNMQREMEGMDDRIAELTREIDEEVILSNERLDRIAELRAAGFEDHKKIKDRNKRIDELESILSHPVIQKVALAGGLMPLQHLDTSSAKELLTLKP